MNRFVRHAACAIAFGFASVAVAQSATTPPPMPKIVFGAPDPALAPAGSYAIDPMHTAVIARMSHIGYSFSVFRFGKVAGTLTWDPKAPASSKLSATVDTASIATPVPGFPEELAGPKYLNSAAYPQATFTSNAFRPTDATHGKVDGTFTLMGKTRPLTFDVTLVGAGPGFMGHPRMGIHAEATINPQDYGLPALFGNTTGLVIDSEFVKQ
ncbi:MAG TPA: YceI family protein [Rhizomicrobium sp.]|nr:YceI family protein [Rhizomicrobium sp.]